MQPISKENFEMVEKYQDLQQVVELKLEDTTCQKFDEEVKEKKVELIVDNDKNQEMVIIENIVKDSIEVKYENESITHNPHVSVNLLKMTTRYVDFHGVEIFNFIINPLLIDVANKLKVDEKKFYATFYEGFKFQNRIELLKHLKYLFIWIKRFQISNTNLRTSFFQVEGSDVGHNFQISLCNLLFLIIFLFNFRYFRFRAFICLFLGAFNVFRSNWFLLWLGIN